MSSASSFEAAESRVRQILATCDLRPGCVVNQWKLSFVGLGSEGSVAVARFERDAETLQVTFKVVGVDRYFARIGDLAIAHDEVEPRLGPDAGKLVSILAARLQRHGSAPDVTALLSNLPPRSTAENHDVEGVSAEAAPPETQAAASGDAEAEPAGATKEATSEYVRARSRGIERIERTRRLFRDDGLEEEFHREGYVVHPGFDADAVARLRTAFAETRCDLGSPFYTTLWSSDVVYRRAVNQALKAVFEPMIDQILLDYRFCFGGFAFKAAGAVGSSMEFHQDWSIVDETEFQAVNLWCPLVDVDTRNGCLAVVPRTHRLADVPRPNSAPGEFASPFEEILPFLQDRFSRPIPSSAGSIIALNPAVFHGSGDNRSGSDRAAIGVMAVPREAAARHYFRISPSHVEVFDVDDEFYRHRVTPMKRPESEVLLDTVSCPVLRLTEEDVHASGLYAEVAGESRPKSERPTADR